VGDRYDIEEARRAKDARNRELGRLEKGKIKLAEVLREPPDALKKTDVWAVLLACQGLGPEGARRICIDANVWPHTRLWELTKRERADMIRALPKRVR
jgi:hypothetical protein